MVLKLPLCVQCPGRQVPLVPLVLPPITLQKFGLNFRVSSYDYKKKQFYFVCCLFYLEFGLLFQCSKLARVIVSTCPASPINFLNILKFLPIVECGKVSKFPLSSLAHFTKCISLPYCILFQLVTLKKKRNITQL